MAIAAPKITSVTRPAANRTWLDVRYDAMQSGYNLIYAFVNGVQATTTSTMNGQVLITSVGGSPMPAANSTPRVWLIARHATNELSGRSNEVNAPAWEPATPTLTAAVRSSASRADLTISGLEVGGRAYIKRRTLPSGTFSQVDAFDITSTSKVHSAPAPGGTTQYEFQVTQGNWSVESDPSSSRSVEAWYQTPPAPLLPSGSVTRNATTGRVTLVIGAPTVTSRNRWLGMYLLRAPKGQPLKRIRTLSPVAQTVHDDTTSLTSAYDYGVESYNETGVSSSRPTASVDAVRDVPNAASGLALTHMGGDVYKLDWSITPTVERPITNQRIVARVPGQTATTTLATAAGNVTTYTLTLPANRVYELAILPTNSVGPAASTSNWAGPAVSTPLNVTALSASWQDASTVRVAWPLRAASIGDALELQFSTQANPDPNNPAHWSPLSSVTNWRTVGSTSHAGVSQLVPHTYRGRSVHTATGRASGWVYSDLLEGQSAPLAPTMVMPGWVDATKSITLDARHNPVDGTAVTGAQIRERLQGSSTWVTHTATLTAGGGRYVLAANTYSNGGNLEVQGRTMGASGVYGEWGHVSPGASLLVPLRAMPTAAFTSPPAGTYEAQTLTVGWDSVGQVSARLELWDDTGGDLQLLGSATVGADVRSYTWSDVVLQDGHDYVVDLLVRDAWQGGEPQRLEITVDYNLPAPPALSAEQAPAASVLLQATPASELDVLRYNFTDQFATWTPLSGGSVGTATLTVDGEAIETTTLQGGATTAESDYNGAAYVVGGFMAYSETGTNLEVNRYEGEFSVGSVLVTLPAGVPTPVRFSASTGSAAHTWRVASYGPTHIWDQVLLTFPPGTSTIDESYFDASTVREGYVYGRLTSGEFYEAIPSSAPANPLPAAATVSIEIWCSESGLPGTYRLCGVTGSGWDYHDEHPRIAPIWYVARAVAASGAWAESTPVRVVVESDSAWLHFGPDRSLSVHGGWNPSLSAAGGRNKVKKRYAGHDRDVTYYGSRKPRAVTAQVSILPGDHGSSREEWLTAAEVAETVLYRDPAGQYLEGDLEGVSWSGDHDMFQRISFTVAESL